MSPPPRPPHFQKARLSKGLHLEASHWPRPPEKSCLDLAQFSTLGHARSTFKEGLEHTVANGVMKCPNNRAKEVCLAVPKSSSLDSNLFHPDLNEGKRCNTLPHQDEGTGCSCRPASSILTKSSIDVHLSKKLKVLRSWLSGCRKIETKNGDGFRKDAKAVALKTAWLRILTRLKAYARSRYLCARVCVQISSKTRTNAAASPPNRQREGSEGQCVPTHPEQAISN